MGRCIVEPDTDGSRDGKPCTVGGILYLVYRAFAETRDGTTGETAIVCVSWAMAWLVMKEREKCE